MGKVKAEKAVAAREAPQLDKAEEIGCALLNLVERVPGLTFGSGDNILGFVRGTDRVRLRADPDADVVRVEVSTKKESKLEGQSALRQHTWTHDVDAVKLSELQTKDDNGVLVVDLADLCAKCNVSVGQVR